MHIHGRESAEWESVERSAASSDHGQPESGGCSWASEKQARATQRAIRTLCYLGPTYQTL